MSFVDETALKVTAVTQKPEKMDVANNQGAAGLIKSDSHEAHYVAAVQYTVQKG